MGLPSISVALATFNGEAHLSQQLADLTAQFYLPAELVVCDDCSTDHTLELIRAFAASAPFPVRVLRNSERLGYRKNFVTCAGLCRSELVAFCDQDDRWSPDKLKSLVPHFDDPDVLLVYHSAEVVTGDGRSLGALYPRDKAAQQQKPLTGPPWQFALGFTQVFRRSLTTFDRWWAGSQDQNVEGEPLAHDQWYFFLASVLGDISFVPDKLAQYQQHGANAYGWLSFAPSLPSRVLKEILGAGRSMDRRAEAAKRRSAILRAAAVMLEGTSKERSIFGAEAYGGLAERYLLRSSLYAGETIRERVGVWRKLLQSGAYDPKDPWQFGRQAFWMDSTIGIAGLYPRSAPDRLPNAGAGQSALE